MVYEAVLEWCGRLAAEVPLQQNKGCCQTSLAASYPHSLSHRARSVGLWCSWSESLRQPTCSTDSTDTKLCKSGPPTSRDETITNGLSLEGVHVGTVNLMISSGTVILILCAVFFYFYCKGRRGFCGPPATASNLRLFSGSSCKGLSTAHGDAGLPSTLPTSPVLNVTDPSAKSSGGNSFDSSGLCTGR